MEVVLEFMNSFFLFYVRFGVERLFCGLGRLAVIS